MRKVGAGKLAPSTCSCYDDCSGAAAWHSGASMADNGATRPGSPDSALQRVLARIEHAGGDVGPVRDDILASWQRCVQAGLQPDEFEVPYDPDVDDGGRLSWAAGSI